MWNVIQIRNMLNALSKLDISAVSLVVNSNHPGLINQFTHITKVSNPKQLTVDKFLVHIHEFRVTHVRLNHLWWRNDNTEAVNKQDCPSVHTLPEVEELSIMYGECTEATRARTFLFRSNFWHKPGNTSDQ